MKYIFLLLTYVSFTHGSEEYDKVKDEFYYIDIHRIAKNDGLKTLCTLYDTAYNEIDSKKRKELIENIKIFHKKHNISYEETLKFIDKQSPLHCKSPLAFAFIKDIDFANYILHDIKIPISNHALHHLVDGVAKNDFSSEYKKIFNYLLEQKVDINAKLKKDTSLGYYLKNLDKRYEKDWKYDASFITALLHAGAQLNIEKKAMKNLAISLAAYECKNYDHCNHNIIAPISAKIFSERLYIVKENYFTLALICKHMNKEYKTIIPKVLINHIATILFRQSDAYDDIHKSLTQINSTIQEKKKWFNEKENLFLEGEKNDAWLSSYKDLHTILSLPFWQQSFKNIVITLNSITEKHSQQSKEN